jgi:6-phosphogluconolactonase (cycloisomerase 2 family)
MTAAFTIPLVTVLHMVLTVPVTEAPFVATTSNGNSAWQAAASFRITQLSGTGCVSDDGTGGACVDATAPMAGAGWVAVSPDNKHVYVTTRTTEPAVVAFIRNQSTGELTQASCISRTGNGGVCSAEPLFSNPNSITIDPSGSNAYVTDMNNSIVYAFARNATTGALTPLSGAGKCVSETGSSGACVDGRALAQAKQTIISSDGAYLYVASYSSNSIAVFQRNTSTGVLTQLAGANGCISSTYAGCTVGRTMAGIDGLNISPDGKNIYAAANPDGAIDVFSRDTSTGVLTQLAGTAGCVSTTGTGGTCAQAAGLDVVNGIVVSPDNANLYATGWVAGGTIISFARNSTTGVITQLAGANGCTNTTGSPCGVARLIDHANFLAISPDGQDVYVPSANGSTTTDGIAVFRRDPGTGVLTQLSGTAGCWQENANSGCSDATALIYPVQLAVAPDGKDVYAAAYASGAVAVFSRTR